MIIDERARGLAAEYQNVLANGFFEEVTLTANCIDGALYNVHFKAKGYIPNDPKYAGAGTGPIFDPATIFERINAMADGLVVKLLSAEVKSADWIRHPDDKTPVCQGTQHDFFLSINFDYKAGRK